MQDKFGEVMIENLKQRDCSLPGVSACASLQAQKIRYSSSNCIIKFEHHAIIKLKGNQ